MLKSVILILTNPILDKEGKLTRKRYEVGEPMEYEDSRIEEMIHNEELNCVYITLEDGTQITKMNIDQAHAKVK